MLPKWHFFEHDVISFFFLVSVAAREKSLEMKLVVKEGHPQVNENDGRNGNDPLNGEGRFCNKGIICKTRLKCDSDFHTKSEKISVL